ncbi:hypothetical protein [Cytobacillus purgationiresistens]|uniref:DUF4901 domain-containing protein n=1 Tax=Cytobacillus purgationiresistens TaxID=863449 RepID=A0ABU0AH78_9BACI|nr:hypothetical protein [Cytobacillus purgationiresistens]MDQ0270614.1 hypothetical protein [Cytobacillus purgationiresistens]
MDSRIKELVDYSKLKWGLEEYYLHDFSIYQNVNAFHETIYSLCTEWFPTHIAENSEDDLNPEGTAVITINLGSRKFESVIFVGDKTFANGVSFPKETSKVIEWIEQETQLTYMKQFQLVNEEKGKLSFKGCIDGIAVSPSGYIELNFDENRNLTFFSVHGYFPEESVVIEEEYTLTLKQAEQWIEPQFQLINFPSFEKNKVSPAYAMEELYVSNDASLSLPFRINDRQQVELDERLYWESRTPAPFSRKELDFSSEVSIEQALSAKPSSDSLPITAEDQKRCVDTAKDFLSLEYPADQGKWILKTLYRDIGYIHAVLKENDKGNYAFQPKLVIIIDPQTYQILNFIDTTSIWEKTGEAEEVVMDKATAYEKIKNLIELTPTYVYDEKQKKYILCGKLDCHYGVNASNGEVVSLDDL